MSEEKRLVVIALPQACYAEKLVASNGNPSDVLVHRQREAKFGIGPVFYSSPTRFNVERGSMIIARVKLIAGAKKVGEGEAGTAMVYFALALFVLGSLWIARSYENG